MIDARGRSCEFPFLRLLKFARLEWSPARLFPPSATPTSFHLSSSSSQVATTATYPDARPTSAPPKLRSHPTGAAHKTAAVDKETSRKASRGSARPSACVPPMGSAVAAAFLLPAAAAKTAQLPHRDQDLRWNPLFHARRPRRSIAPVARLFGPAIFEASKLKVMFLGVDQDKHPGHLPRTYTLTHSDVTAKLTLAIAHTINNNQLGWYNKLQRDEVVAEWKKVKGKMSLHVHCHISGGHFLLDFIAKLRYYIFSKELPVVLKAFVHGDMDLFCTYPELEESLVWVYFHSNLPEFNKVECWGPLRDAASGDPHPHTVAGSNPSACPRVRPRQCSKDCSCCFPPSSTIPWAHEFEARYEGHLNQQRQQHL